MKDDGAGASSGEQSPSSAAVERLQLQVSSDIGEITGVTLEAVVPGFADAAVVFTAESLFQSDLPAVARPVRPDPSGRVVVRRAGGRFAWGGPSAGAVPPGEVVVFAGGSPYARCVSDGKPVAFPRPDGQVLEEAGSGSRDLLSRYASFLAVPLKADRTVVGLLALAREPVRPEFSDADIAGIERIAASAGAGFATMTALERYRAISDALQKGPVTAELPQSAYLDVAGQCLPAKGHLVGGDWYDIIGLPGGRTGIVVGDVMGHGAEAAVIMAQLRSAARVLAQMDLAPAVLLSRLNQLIMSLSGAPMATCIYAVIDPAMQSCTLAAAGHLPPVLARPGSGARILDLPSGLSLGVGTSDFGQASIRLHAGGAIAFCTDGLVETRRRSFDQGISALCAELDRAGDRPLDAVSDNIIRSLAADSEDDVTLILVRIPELSHRGEAEESRHRDPLK